MELFQAIGGILPLGALPFLGLGVAIGMVFGVIPGLGGPIALALILPFTFSMEPSFAIALAGGIMGATSFAGSISAILLNTPGTPVNAATTIDGFPMAQQGRAGQALGASATASAIGGLFGLLTLVAVIPAARALILSFGPSEQFLLTVLGLCTVAALSGGNLRRGLICVLLGVALSQIGFDDLTGAQRLTLGVGYLWDGLPLVPLLTGLFALSQMSVLSIDGNSVSSCSSGRSRLRNIKTGMQACFARFPLVLQSSIIGTLIGALPGVGGTVASFMAYSAARVTARAPSQFGRGDIRGVIAPESANNAKDGGSMIPTLAFGLAGSAEAAVFLGVLVMQGIEPGPTILLYHADIVYALILALTVSALMASVIGLAAARWLLLLAHVNGRILAPITITTGLIGVFVLNLQIGDVVVALCFGVLGYLMLRLDFPRVPLVIGFFLGPLAETSFVQSQNIANGNWADYLATRPQFWILLAVFGVSLAIWLRFRRFSRT